MNENRLMQQVTAIFSLFMVFFYIGVGVYFIYVRNRSYLDRSVWVIMGGTFIFYGVYRAFRAYVKIVEAFFNNKNNEK